MARVIVGMVMSLDGFVADRNGDIGLLYPDFEAMVESEPVQESIRTTGAVVLGRRSYDMSNGDYTGYEYQVPIFVPTHQPPEQTPKGQNENLTITFVTDGVARAIELAKAAAGERDVTVIGASTIRQCIEAGLADELHIDLRSLLLGDGLRLFEQSDMLPMELERIDVNTTPGVTHLRYRLGA
jgi:dihydrofolate reductase